MVDGPFDPRQGAGEPMGIERADNADEKDQDDEGDEEKERELKDLCQFAEDQQDERVGYQDPKQEHDEPGLWSRGVQISHPAAENTAFARRHRSSFALFSFVLNVP
jgi:hypothetical protein